MNMHQFFIYVGIIFIGCRLIKWIQIFCVLILTRQKLDQIQTANNSSDTRWAVITGATDGIGKGYALVLAQKGYNLILFVRNKQKAADLAIELKKQNSQIQIKVIITDFTLSLEQGYIKSRVDEIDPNTKIDLLVNNVGIFEGGFIQALAIQKITDSISVNCAASCLITLYIIPRMNINNKPGIINLSSIMADLMIQKNHYLYGATKRFNDYFSRGLQIELGSQFEVLSQTPLFVTTPMTNQKQSGISPVQCAESGLKVLGYLSKSPGHPQHIFQQEMIFATPNLLQQVAYILGTKQTKSKAKQQ